MRIKLLTSSISQEKFQFAASFVINDSVAIDAGSIGFCRLEDQRRIRHVFLSHHHLDHICSLPIFIDNVYESAASCPTIYGTAEVIDCLKKDFFNDRVWPDILRLSCTGSPFAKFVTIRNGNGVQVDGLKITPVPLGHVVPCVAFLIESSDASVAIISDTGPTSEIWNLANQARHLKAIFLESAFPNSLASLAKSTKHLTPQLFLQEYRKLQKDVPIVAIHIKPPFYDQVVSELGELGIPGLLIGEPNRVYEF